MTRQAASNLLSGHAGLSAEMAIRFETSFAVEPEPLMRMEAAHALAEAGAREGEILVEAA